MGVQKAKSGGLSTGISGAGSKRIIFFFGSCSLHLPRWTLLTIISSVLLPSTTSPLEEQQEEGAELFIVDWEFAQFGHRAYDLGQMIGDLYERKHFLNANGAAWAIEGLIEGIGAVSEEMAFRTAIHTGVQLICWCKRGSPDRRPPWATPEKIAGVVKLGMEFVLKGWEKDMEWLEGSMLGGLFGRN